MRDYGLVSLPNGEVSGTRDFGWSGCNGCSAGGGAKEEKKKLLVSWGWLTFWEVGLDVPLWPMLLEVACHHFVAAIVSLCSSEGWICYPVSCLGMQEARCRILLSGHTW